MNWLRNLIQRHAWLRRAPRLLRRQRIPIVLLWAALIFGLTETERFAHLIPLQKAEQMILDTRFAARGPQPAHPDVLIIGINNSSLDQQTLEALAAESPALEIMAQERFPWSRKVWAVLIERLMEAGARMVAVDLIFDGDFPGNDELAAVVEKYRDRLVLGAKFSDTTPDGQATQLTYTPPATSLIGEGDNSALVGSCLFRGELDQRIRRFDFRTSMLREYGIEDDSDDIVSFAPLAVAKFLGQEAPRGYRQLINFQGPATTYPHYAMEEVIAALENRTGQGVYHRDPRYRGGEMFRGKLIFLGPAAEILHDVHNTPFGEMPGVEIHAQIAGGLLSGKMLKDAPPQTARWLTLAACILAAGSVLLSRQAAGQLLALFALIAIGAFATQWFFSYHHLLIPVGGAAVALGAVGLFGVVLTFTIEQLEKGIIRGVLDRYVSKNVASLVVEKADDFAQMLRGEKKHVTILFSDVRGFTSIFETSDAVSLVGQLNEYFGRMVSLILGHGGTLQKFIGDAIMAAWGDTHSLGYEEDALRATKTALAMREALEELNAGWSGAPDRIEMKIGIGVNHGEVVIGEIGSPDRKEFTALGDAINTAARFESATKQYHVDILVGGSVERLTRGHFVYRCVDKTCFKGKKLPVETFTILSDATVPAPAWLAPYHAAVEHFRSSAWEKAEELFHEVNAALGGDDFLCGMYLARIAEYRVNPPPPDWDGSHTLTEK